MKPDDEHALAACSLIVHALRTIRDWDLNNMKRPGGYAL